MWERMSVDFSIQYSFFLLVILLLKWPAADKMAAAFYDHNNN